MARSSWLASPLPVGSAGGMGTVGTVGTVFWGFWCWGSPWGSAVGAQQYSG
jgi:hypothetical protein